MKIRLDKIASSTRNANLAPMVTLSDEIVAKEGYVIAARVLKRKQTYNELEDLHGRMVKIKEGDLIAGVLGKRKALRGYSGSVPEAISQGDTLSLLNLGGVIGKVDSGNPDLGEPTPVEVLGAILSFPSLEERIGIPAHIRNGAIGWAESVGPCAPVIYVSGTCMNTGKTTACAEIIREFTHRGIRVAGAKLTGVSLLRDTLQMEDCGAVKSLNFTDAGVASTADGHVVPIAKGILNALQKWKPDVMVVELGDGIAGEYGVQEIMADRELMGLAKAHVVCAGDPVGAFGAAKIVREAFGLPIAVISGPVTDNQVGCNYVRKELDIQAFNARTEYRAMVDHLERKVFENGRSNA